MELIATFFPEPSLLLLFILSFLAASVVPLGSEWLLVLMVLDGTVPTENLVLTATCGNYLGACTTYALGILGSHFLISKVLRITSDQLKRTKNLYRRYGSYSLLLSWIPIIGDPICLVGGIFKINFFRFSILVFLGKFSRYATLALFVQYGIGG